MDSICYLRQNSTVTFGTCSKTAISRGPWGYSPGPAVLDFTSSEIKLVCRGEACQWAIGAATSVKIHGVSLSVR